MKLVFSVIFVLAVLSHVTVMVSLPLNQCHINLYQVQFNLKLHFNYITRLFNIYPLKLKELLSYDVYHVKSHML